MGSGCGEPGGRIDEGDSGPEAVVEEARREEDLRRAGACLCSLVAELPMAIDDHSGYEFLK